MPRNENSVAGIDPSYGEVLYWKYYDRKDVVDIVIESPPRFSEGDMNDSGMRLAKYHCRECHIIFGYDRPVESESGPAICPACGASDSMKPGKPGILVKKLQPLKP